VSSAFGYNNLASGLYSSAIGYSNTASALTSVAYGYLNTASDYTSVAFGNNNNSIATGTTAVGITNTASGLGASAFGYNNLASGLYSSAIGYSNTASGQGSTAVGRSTIASGPSSGAFGYLLTTTANQSFMFGHLATNTNAQTVMFGRDFDTASTTTYWGSNLLSAGSVALGTRGGGVTVTNAGNVGIGTSAPTNALHIASSTTWTSGLRLGITSATTATSSNGKVLTVNSNGDVVLAVDGSVYGTDVIAAKTTALTAAMSNTAQVVVFNTESQDINSGYNNTTGVYTVPAGGSDTYTIDTQLGFTVANFNSRTPCVAIRRNGTIISSSCNSDYNDTAGGTTGSRNSVAVSATIALTAGQTIDVVTYTDTNPTTGTVPTFSTTAGTNYFVIKRTGNAALASDERLKSDVKNFSFGLEELLKLRTVSYFYNGKAKGAQNDGIEHVGVLAQEVQSTSLGKYAVATGTDGYLRFDKDPIIFTTVNSIQEITKGLTEIDIATTTTSTTTVNGVETLVTTDTFAGKFWKNVKAQLITWFADVANGIGDFFAKKVYTDEICVKKSDGAYNCVNGDSLNGTVVNYTPTNNTPTNTPTVDNTPTTTDPLVDWSDPTSSSTPESASTTTSSVTTDMSTDVSTTTEPTSAPTDIPPNDPQPTTDTNTTPSP
jgi:hypothetical protein